MSTRRSPTRRYSRVSISERVTISVSTARPPFLREGVTISRSQRRASQDLNQLAGRQRIRGHSRDSQQASISPRVVECDGPVLCEGPPILLSLSHQRDRIAILDRRNRIRRSPLNAACLPARDVREIPASTVDTYCGLIGASVLCQTSSGDALKTVEFFHRVESQTRCADQLGVPT